MVNSISLSTGINSTADTDVKRENVQTLIKYANGEILSEKPDTFSSGVKSAASSAAMFKGLPFVNFLRRNKFISGSIKSNDMLQLDKLTQNSFKNIFKGEGSLTSRISNFINTANKNTEIYELLQEDTKAGYKAAKLEQKAAGLRQKVIEGKAKDKSLEKLTNKILSQSEKLSASRKAVNEAIEKASGKVTEVTSQSSGKIAKLMSKLPGGAKIAGKLGGFGKFMKSSGAGIMLAFSGIFEFMTEVKPTFEELGFKKGMKQLGKSSIKVVGDTVGYVAGQQIGTAIGSAIGTALFPGVGTAVGSVVGFGCGILGSFVTGKITKPIVGKTEREIAKEQQQANDANSIANNADELEQLKAEVFARIEADREANNGELSEDAQIASDILSDLDGSETGIPSSASDISSDLDGSETGTPSSASDISSDLDDSETGTPSSASDISSDTTGASSLSGMPAASSKKGLTASDIRAISDAA